jgi:hypothetical protein
MDQFLSTKSKTDGSILHYNVDTEKGVPYCGLHVGENGDYWCTVYGALSFPRSSHTRMIEKYKPIGKDITAKKFYGKK